MARTLTDFTNAVILDAGATARELDKIKKFVNRGYRELCKREKWASIGDMTDGVESETYPENDEFILAWTKYLYWQESGNFNRAEVFKRDAETMQIKTIPKTITIVVER